MENRPLSVAARLTALLALGFSALAAASGPTPVQEADWKHRLDKASTMQSEGRKRLSELDKALAKKEAECNEKFRVNDCREDARAEYRPLAREAKAMEAEGKALEREVKREQLADRDKRWADEAGKREADLQARETETAALRQAAQEKEAATRADKAEKAKEGARRKAAQAEKSRAKREKHEARNAKKMREAEQRAAKPEAPAN